MPRLPAARAMTPSQDRRRPTAPLESLPGCGMSTEVRFEAVPQPAPPAPAVLFERSLEWLLENWEAVAVKVVDDRYAMVGVSPRYGRATTAGPLVTVEAGDQGHGLAYPHIRGRTFRPALNPFPLTEEEVLDL